VSQDVSPSLAFQFGLSVDTGAYVVDVSPGGPAQGAGIQTGDVIVGFDGRAVTGAEQLGSLIRAREPGDTVRVEVVGRDGVPRALDVTLGVNPLP